MKTSRPKLTQPAELAIHVIRGQRVILDADLAKVYAVATKRINEAVRRNKERFPEDFAFQLTRQEVMNLRSQIATSSTQTITVQRNTKSNRGATYRPWAFTEHGALMVANILRSPRAVQMSVYVVRAFVKQREQLMANVAILKHLAEIDKTLLGHDEVLRVILAQLQPLLEPPPSAPKPRIGFGT